MVQRSEGCNAQKLIGQAADSLPSSAGALQAPAWAWHETWGKSVRLCRALQSEVADAAKLIQKPAELKAAVMHTYQTFVDGNAADRTRDISMEAEFNRCRWLARSGDVHGQGMICSCVTLSQCRQGPVILLLPLYLLGGPQLLHAGTSCIIVDVRSCAREARHGCCVVQAA